MLTDNPPDNKMNINSFKKGVIMRSDFKIMKASQTKLNVRSEMAAAFSEGFTQWLGYFSKDEKVIAEAFAHMFVLEEFYVAVKDDRVAAFGACTDGKTKSVRLQKSALRRHLGYIKGTIAKIALKKEFEKIDQTFPENTGSIEFVGTSKHFRRQGAASLLLEYILEHEPYEEFVISEVADTNSSAMNLYTKIGFIEYDRKAMPAKLAKKSGINSLLSLKYRK